MEIKFLSSFFKKPTTSTETAPDTETATDKVEETADQQEEASEEQEETEQTDKTASAAGKTASTAGNNVSISQERYEAFVAAQVELQKFGSTAEDRSAFLADAKQLHTWYENTKKAGVKTTADASVSTGEKGGKVSRTTKEAIEIAEKSKKK